MDDRVLIDPAVDKVALGPFRTEFQTGSRRHYLVFVGTILLTGFCACMVVIFGAVYFANPDAPKVGMGGMVGFGLLATLPLVSLFIFLEKLSWRILLFTHGFVLVRNKKPEMILWDQIKYVLEKRVHVDGVETGVWLRIELFSGQKITLDVSFKEMSALAERIREGSQPSLLARALTQLGLKSPVEFGAIKLFSDGLANTKEKITWNQVESIAIEPSGGLNNLIVRKKGEQRFWTKLAGPDFPNMELFLLLTNRLREGN